MSGTSIFVNIVEISLIFIENKSYELSESAKRESTSAVYDEIGVTAMVGNSHLKTPSANTELATRVKEKVKAYYKAYRRNNNFDFKVKSKLFQQAMRQAKHQHNSKLLDNAKPEPTKYWKIVNDEKVRKGRRKVKLRR